MNYITEINSFYIWLTGNHISGNAQALWHRLMAYCNSFAWKSEFTISNMRLADDIGVSRQELDRLRNKLVQKGLITYKKGIGNQCGKYTMVSLSRIVTQDVTQLVTQDVTQDVTQSDTQLVTQSGHNALPLDKLNETKLNNTPLTPKGKEPSKVPLYEQSFYSCKEILVSADLSEEEKAKLEQWLQHKRERKDKYTDIGFNMLISEYKSNIKQFGSEAVWRAIDQSMASGYAGIIWGSLSKVQREPIKTPEKTDRWEGINLD